MTNIGVENFKLEVTIKKMVHEIMHVLFFNINLFEYYPDHNGQNFRFVDTDGITKLQGVNILEQIRDHFNCATATGGI